MKLFQKQSLRMRITLFSGTAMLLASVLLTALSMYHAQNQFMVVAYNYRDLKEDTAAADFPAENTKITVTSAEMPAVALSEAEADPAYQEESLYTLQASDAITVKAVRQFNSLSLVSMIVISLSGMLLVYWLAGKALKPVHTLTCAISAITEDTLNQRIPEPAARDEIGSLTRSFNAMLERLDEAFLKQKQFASNAAHELKTPIATIKANLEILEVGQTPALEEYQQSCAVVKRTADRLSGVIDDLMALTDNGYQLHTDILSLQAMLKSIVKELLPVYAAKNISVTYAFDDPEQFVVCNETLACRLFTNLIENAMKYNTDNGAITLSVKAAETAATVTISDTGIGIAAQDQDKIWDAFYCADKSRSRKLGGAGLGLSIVKAIAEQFCWDISVTSALSAGTTVTVVCTNKWQEI